MPIRQPPWEFGPSPGVTTPGQFGARFLHGLIHRVKDRHIVGKELPAFAGGYACGNVRSVVKTELGVPRAEAARDSLHENAGFGGDENGHVQKSDLR